MKNEIRLARLLFKALSLFVVVNVLFALLPARGSKVSGYNVWFPGRTRLPFGVAGDPYTVTVDELDTMFDSHLIAAPRQPQEFRIVLIGDSSIWGEGLSAQDVISEQWNRLNARCGNKTIRTYNLGYPHPSVLKDLVILDKALEYKPDLVIWFVTLNSLISQRVNPFLDANRDRTVNLLNTYQISFQQGKKLANNETSFLERTLVGQRSNVARGIKLQLLGLIWAATGADTNTQAQESTPDYYVGDDPRYRGMAPPADITSLLLFSALSAGQEMADPRPLWIVNEPIFVHPQANAMVRYNAGYPRWAYDQYREAMTAQAGRAGWSYLDLWDAIPPQYFLDTSLHLGADGERLLVEQINPVLLSTMCNELP